MDLQNKRIIITAGPTWVPIDSVRIISNIATGKTGILLAEEANRKGFAVTLLLGAVGFDYKNEKLDIQHFRYFTELKQRLIGELKQKKYDVIIHSAAVSDFGVEVLKGKIASNKSYNLRLKPLPKIIRIIRKRAPRAKLVMFKLETGVPDRTLIKRAKTAKSRFNADIAVANRINPYRAFIIDRNKIITVKNKSNLARRLINLLCA